MSTRSFSRATIVGGNGFIGRSIALDLKRRGLEVDVPEAGSLRTIEESELLVWAAGYTADFGEAPERTIAAHAGDLAELLARARPRTCIYLSSARLFDGQAGTVSETTPVCLDPAKSRHLFDLSKGLGEWLVRHQLEGTGHVLRLAGVYADALDGGSFLEDLIARALEGWSGPVETAPDVARDYVHIADVVDAVWTVAVTGTEPLYLVGSGETVDNETVLGLLSERTGTRLEPSLEPSGSHVPTLDVARLRGLGVEPRALSEGLDRVLTFQDNKRAMQSMLGVTQMPWM